MLLWVYMSILYIVHTIVFIICESTASLAGFQVVLKPETWVQFPLKPNFWKNKIIKFNQKMEKMSVYKALVFSNIQLREDGIVAETKRWPAV